MWHANKHVGRIKQSVAYPQYIKQIVSEDRFSNKEGQWNAIKPGYLTLYIINYDHRILWKSMVHVVISYEIFYENYLVFLFQKCIHCKKLFETCIHMSIIFLSYIFLVYLLSNIFLIFFSSIGDSMASCNARKKEISENALSTPLTLGSTFKSTQPPSSLSYNNMGDFSRSSNGDQDASVQSIIEKMQTGLEVDILLSDSCVSTSHHREMNQPGPAGCLVCL